MAKIEVEVNEYHRAAVSGTGFQSTDPGASGPWLLDRDAAAASACHARTRFDGGVNISVQSAVWYADDADARNTERQNILGERADLFG